MRSVATVRVKDRMNFIITGLESFLDWVPVTTYLNDTVILQISVIQRKKKSGTAAEGVRRICFRLGTFRQDVIFNTYAPSYT